MAEATKTSRHTRSAESLAEGFDAANLADWRALAESTLNGRGVDDTLVTRLVGGIPVQPLYMAENARIEPQPAMPHGWHILEPVSAADGATANEMALDGLERGATGLVLRLDDGVQGGVPLNGMSRALKGVHLDMAALWLDAGVAGDRAAEDALAWMESRGLDGDAVTGSLGLDPLLIAARMGGAPTDLNSMVADHAYLGADGLSRFPHLRPFHVMLDPVRLAGGGPVLELAVMLGAGVAYLRGLEAAGVPLKQAVGAIAFSLALDTDMATGIAKLRAAHRLWHHVAAASGAPLDGPAPVGAVASMAMLTSRDPWVNIVRQTLSGVAGALGGARHMMIPPFDSPLGAPGPLARRISRNVQVIAQEESHLNAVSDPVAGAYAFETLTTDLAEAAWQRFQAIESAGGLAAWIMDGGLNAATAEDRAERDSDIRHRRTAIIGVSDYPLVEETLPEGTGAPLAPVAAPPNLTVSVPRLVSRRDSAVFEALRDRADGMETPPHVFLAAMGPLKRHTARAGFARNALAAGGFRVLDTDGFDTPSEAAKAFGESGADLAVIAGDDAQYEKSGANMAAALKQAGARRVVLAGPEITAIRDAGATDFIHAGCDLVTVLDALLSSLEAGRNGGKTIRDGESET
ncbi:methylmalonyl-CoA mutase family protein [Yunchengibacter salinarum]|uniref:methylmalonyl-CoA mutase family protein n=1 Tax=Yunchengibacter salinarum TaxID=3133399 RepID=UPI0035B6995B